MVVLLVWIYIEIEYFWFGNGMRNKSFGLDMYLKNCIFGLEMLYFHLFSFGLLKISCIFAACFKKINVCLKESPSNIFVNGRKKKIVNRWSCEVPDRWVRLHW